MKSPSLDTIHAQLNKHILLAHSYTEISELAFIIKSCRLKPYDYIFGNGSTQLRLHRWWIDEFGNSLHIKDKKISITYNDLSLDKNKIVCTDLYYGLSLNKIAKMSRLAYICAGVEEEKQQECFFLTFLGLDNYLRSYMFLYEEWQQVSPLILGLKNLKLLGRHTDIKFFKEYKNKENMPIPCLSAQEWLTFMPPSQALIEQVKKQHPILLPIINNENT